MPLSARVNVTDTTKMSPPKTIPAAYSTTKGTLDTSHHSFALEVNITIRESS